MPRRVDLVADGIENPGNAQALIDAARMFGSHCLFRDRGTATSDRRETIVVGEDVGEITAPDLAAHYSPVVAFDNLPHACSMYGFHLAEGPRPAMIVGNERRGISRELQAIATYAVEIPLVSKRLNCLNVAAAAAVGLYYLSREGGGKLLARSEPAHRRPELLLVGPGDHIELGSSIRSACAFGWGRVFVEDREQKWFASDRITRSEGRGAARRGRNSIHVIPTTSDQRYGFDEVSVITANSASTLGTPLYRANLANGHQQVIAIPDEGRVDVKTEDWGRIGKTVKFVHVGVPHASFAARYRLITAITLAEVARQVGRKGRRGRPGRADLRYERSLDLLPVIPGDLVTLSELAVY